MAIDGVEKFWEELEDASDTLKERFEAQPQEQLTRPKLFVVPTFPRKRS